MYVYNLTLCCNFINGSLFFLRLSFFRTLLSSQKNGEYRDFSHILCFYTCIAPSIINITHKNNTFVITDESTLTHLSHPKSTVYFMIHLDAVQSMDLGECTLTFIYRFGIIQWIFTCPKSSTFHLFIPPFLLHHVEATDLFTSSIVLDFSEHHIIGVT